LSASSASCWAFVDGRDPLGQLAEIVREAGDVSGATTLVGVITLIAARHAPLVSLLPAALIVVSVSIAASWTLDFSSHGIAISARSERSRASTCRPFLLPVLELVRPRSASSSSASPTASSQRFLCREA
jgi:hypothetical protein